VRGALRTGLVLLLGFIAGSRLISAWKWVQVYREWGAQDPSLADAASRSPREIWCSRS